jgi:DNA-binding transcriptional LysR family regulator
MMNETDLTRADLNLLVLFEAVMEERSVTRAAARLRVSPSAVSHGLVRLRRLLNDPLFLKHPKGMVPTARALDIAAAVDDILTRIRTVVMGATWFDPAHSSRRFTIGAPDGVSAVVLPPLFSAIERVAPHIDLSERTVMPQETFKALDASVVDIVVGPAITEIPARFACETLYEEEFVIGMRAGHRLARRMTLEDYCAAAHLLVSGVGDPDGFVDLALETRGLSRRVAFVAPNFMLALALLSETDLIAALPRRLAEKHAARFGLVFAYAPLPLETHRICAILPKAALADAGVAWLFGMLRRC